MIVYNVKRRWYTMKADAERCRVDEGLPPGATAKIEVKDRDDLAALLNALCEPQLADTDIVPPAVVDRAYVDANLKVPDCVPEFLRRSWEAILR